MVRPHPAMAARCSGYNVGMAYLVVALGCLMAGYFAGHLRWSGVVRRLRMALLVESQQLREARSSVDLVKALHDGDIGIDDLREAGFDHVQQGRTGKLRGLRQSDYQPFSPLPYRRRVEYVGDMVPGDQVWVSLSEVRHRARDCAMVVSRDAVCSVRRSSERLARVRRTANGAYELAIDPNDTARVGTTICDGVVMTHVTTLRYDDCYRPRRRR